MATLQLGEEVAHALIRNLAGNDNIPDRNSIRGWAPSLWLGWVKSGHLKTNMKRLFRARTPIAAFCVNRASMDADHAERHVPIWRTRARYGVEKCMIHLGFCGSGPVRRAFARHLPL